MGPDTGETPDPTTDQSENIENPPSLPEGVERVSFDTTGDLVVEQNDGTIITIVYVSDGNIPPEGIILYLDTRGNRNLGSLGGIGTINLMPNISATDPIKSHFSAYLSGIKHGGKEFELVQRLLKILPAVAGSLVHLDEHDPIITSPDPDGPDLDERVENHIREYTTVLTKWVNAHPKLNIAPKP